MTVIKNESDELILSRTVTGGECALIIID